MLKRVLVTAAALMVSISRAYRRPRWVWDAAPKMK